MRALLIVLGLVLAGCQTTAPAGNGGQTQLNVIARAKGPQAASGAVIFISGANSYDPEHHKERKTPDILHWLDGVGFDVYRLDLSVPDQLILQSMIDRARSAATTLRSQGYRKIYVVGQSAGGYTALMALSRGEVFADGAIAFAPGVNARQEPNQQIDWHREVLSNLDPRLRVAVFHFQKDEFFESWADEGIKLSRRFLDGRPNAMVHVPSVVFGHQGFDRTGFTRTYGDCLSRFLAADQPDGKVCD